jgi:putative molybdopterin biosynthesis protein
MEEKLYTPQEAADLLKIKKNTVYDMIKKGTLNATKMGKQFRITESDLQSLLNPYRAANSSGIKENARQGSSAYNDNIVVCGQDIVLDMLCSAVNSRLGSARFVRSYEGSYNGLHSLYMNEVTAASAHLWDKETNTYNLPFIHALIPGEEVQLYHVLNRPVGLYVSKGNPADIKDIHDFSRTDIRIVNREKGSGIRILTDSLLACYNIDKSQIKGYERMVNSHLAAAAIVAKGGADCAVGTQNTAMQFANLDFIFLKDEQYDIAIKTADLKRPEIRTMLDILQSEHFREEVDAMGWYNTTDMGKRLL